MSGAAPRPAVFLDRDGVLNEYLPGDYVKTPDEMRLLPGIGAAVRRFNEAGYRVFIISNQQGVAKGLMTDEHLWAVDAVVQEAMRKAGARIERSYYCTEPSHANSPFRKPRPGMILQAAEEHGLDLAASFFIGDTETDAEAARAAGVGHFVLVLTGKHGDASAVAAHFPVPPDHVALSLTEAADWILRKG